MDQEYDAVILGTGLKECLLAGLLSVDGMKVLHMDRNSYYGGEAASLNLKQLWERFRPGEPEPTKYGRWQDWRYVFPTHHTPPPDCPYTTDTFFFIVPVSTWSQSS